LQDARIWFEHALGVLEALPERPSTLEQGFEIRLALRPVLAELSEVPRMPERVHEAATIAERLIPSSSSTTAPTRGWRRHCCKFRSPLSRSHRQVPPIAAVE